MKEKSFELNVDTGGTFTDCLTKDSEGNILRRKVLSNGSIRGSIIHWKNKLELKVREQWKLEKDILAGYTFQLLNKKHPDIKLVSFDADGKILKLDKPLPEDLEGFKGGFELRTGEEAPVLAARLISESSLSEKIPVHKIKLGSTKGTNALLERKGSDTVFFVTKGFKDLLKIRYQQRPDIFARNIQKPISLYQEVIEVKERIDAEGKIIEGIDTEDLVKEIARLGREQQYDSAAVALLNSYKNPDHEIILESILRETGFQSVSISSKLSSLIKYIPRAETTVVNAYLDTIIQNYLDNISEKIYAKDFFVMNSAGGLVRKGKFHPKDSLLSGPAGGVVGAAAVGRSAGYKKIISFDMGGTSTDVSRISEKFDYSFELEVGDAKIFSPALSIETVAAGGGSICYYDGFKLSVGPDSAGASPGPACYGAGGPLTITDINLLSGRLDPKQFGIPVFPDDSLKRINELIDEIFSRSGVRRKMEDLIEGFLQIANEIMAGAIRKVSVSKGYKPADHVLVAFGGAGGMHASAIADLLHIHTILLPRDAGLLSAYGISRARVERIAEKQVLLPYSQVIGELPGYFHELDKLAMAMIKEEGVDANKAMIRERYAYLRFIGQDSALEISYSGEKDLILGFKEEYIKIYGHWSEKEEIEIESLRVISSSLDETETKNLDLCDESCPEPKYNVPSYSCGKWIESPVYFRKDLIPGSSIKGYALILDEFSTWLIEEDWTLRMDQAGTAIMEKMAFHSLSDEGDNMDSHDEIELELFTNRFMSVAMNMGSMLQRTSVSVNVKERLDFSCALLNEKGELVANAPHIPVHLGSLGVCVRELASKIDMGPGDTIITNHPAYGGSHLPDITLVTPVFTSDRNLVGYVVNRAHHAEIGGKLPASMPPDAVSLAEEGVVISPTYLVRNHKPDWEKIRGVLSGSRYPSRAVDENIADLNAALAANMTGEKELLALVEEHGLGKVRNYMRLLEQYADKKMRETLSRIPNGVYQGMEYLDDGTALKVGINIAENSCRINFTGTGDVHPGNMNATRAIVNGVVIYVLRLLIDENIPLNDGILKPVELIIPQGMLNPEFPDDPELCPAIVGGNVELSQRLTDTLLKPFNILACSQGTMNNVLFGNENFSYYETICGGCGAGNGFHGASAVHHHMTNTRITDPEILEYRYPVRLLRFEIRKNSGGEGKYSGGEGVEREILFLEPVSLSVLTQHRTQKPYGLRGGLSGQMGEQYVIRANGDRLDLKSVDGADILAGDVFVIKTPGGGGFGMIND